MSANDRSKARYARAAFVLPPITLDNATDMARRAIATSTGEQTSTLIRRLLMDEAARIVKERGP